MEKNAGSEKSNGKNIKIKSLAEVVYYKFITNIKSLFLRFLKFKKISCITPFFNLLCKTAFLSKGCVFSKKINNVFDKMFLYIEIVFEFILKSSL